MSDAIPRQNYIVAATPRSGSTLLCELLKASGVAGRPAEDFQELRATSRSRQPRQYFDGIDAPFIQALAPTNPGTPETAEQFAAKLAQARTASTTPNGVFGTKVMWGYFDQLAERLATLPGLAEASLNDALGATFPGLKFVQIQRPDKIGQAISLWTAVQTLTWRDEGEAGAEPVEPVYDFDAIKHLVDLQTSHEEAWTAWLAASPFPHTAVIYDELAAAPQETVRGVLRWLEVPEAETAQIPPPKMRRQSNGRSSEWAERYRDELLSRGPATPTGA
jgi:LPS sulfotransferase NodH